MSKLRKIFTISIMLVTVLSMSVVVVPEVGASASAGDLIKMDGLASVYYLGADGKRYVFPNEATYFSWYSDWSGVVTIPQSELEGYSLAANVVVRPGTKLVKITTNPTVYAVETDGVLRSIISESNAATLWGAAWASRVIDVPDAFFTNYSVGTPLTAGVYPAGSLVKFSGSADVYYTNTDGTVSKFADEASLLANRLKMADVVTATITMPTVGTIVTGTGLIDTSQGGGAGTGIVAGVGTGLSVALASATPASTTLITNTAATGNGQALVPFTTVNFTAAADGDVKVTSVKFKRNGISADADTESLFLYDGATRLTAEASVSSNYVTFNNSAGLFTVTSGTTRAITLKGDILYSATAGKTIGFELVAATDVTTNGASVSGSFPMTGNLMSTADTSDLGKLIITNTFPTAAQTIDPEATEVEVAKFKLTGSGQALNVEKLVFTEIGSIQKDDLANFKLLDPGGTVIGTTASLNDSYELIFDLDYAMAKGVARTLSLRADIIKGSTRTFYFSIQNKYDIVVKDTSYGVYVQAYEAGSFEVIDPTTPATMRFTINEGSLSINRSTSAPIGYVTLDGTSVVVGAWDFIASGEDMKVKDLTAVVTTTGETKGGLDNAKIYVDGSQLGTTKDLTDSSYDGTGESISSWGFGSSFIVEAGATAKVQVIADIKTSTSTSYVADDTIRVSLASTASQIQRMASLSYQAAITAVNGTGAVLTVSAAGLTISKYSGYGNQTLIAGTNGVKLGAFVITAGSAEGVSVSSITVGLGTYEAVTITNMYLEDSDGVVLSTAKNVPGTSNIYSLSPNIAMAKNASKQINLWGNIKSGATSAGAWNASMTANGSGVITGNAVAGAVTVLQTITIASAGTISAANGTMPDAAIVIAGSSANEVAEFRFSAVNEGFTIDQLKLKVTNNFATSTSAVGLSYTDVDGNTQTANGMFISVAADAYATATFSGLSIYVPANEDSTVKVNISMANFADSGTSGANSTILLDFDEGFNATGDAGTSDTALSADLESESFYVRKSKPTFAKQTLTGAPSTGVPLYRFTVVADNAGAIEIKQLGFTITTNGMDADTFYLYKPSSGTTLTDSAVRTSALTTGGDIVLLVGDKDDNDIISVGSTPIVYEVRGAVSNYTSSDSDSMTVRFAKDVAAKINGTAFAKGADDSVAAASEMNIWSDRSASAHTTATSDWTNGFLLKGMDDIQQLP